MSDNIGIGEATKRAKEYVKEYRPNDWDRVVNANQGGNKTKIDFQTTDDTDETHRVTFDDQGDIINIRFRD